MNVFFTSRIGENENDVYPNGSPPLFEVIKDIKLRDINMKWFLFVILT